MRTTRRTLLQLATTLAASRILPLRAQDWPLARPVRLLIGTAAGGSPDIIGRLIGDKLSDRSVVVEKRKLIESGNIATPSTADAMGDRIAKEMARWGQVSAAAGIKVE